MSLAKSCAHRPVPSVRGEGMLMWDVTFLYIAALIILQVEDCKCR